MKKCQNTPQLAGGMMNGRGYNGTESSPAILAVQDVSQQSCGVVHLGDLFTFTEKGSVLCLKKSIFSGFSSCQPSLF